MSARTTALVVCLVVAMAAVACVYLWTTVLRYEIVDAGRGAVHVLDRKTGHVQWIVRGKVRNSTGPYIP